MLENMGQWIQVSGKQLKYFRLGLKTLAKFFWFKNRKQPLQLITMSGHAPSMQHLTLVFTIVIINLTKDIFWEKYSQPEHLKKYQLLLLI